MKIYSAGRFVTRGSGPDGEGTVDIIQGAGRSVRSKDDRAVTYILDAHAQRLFSSKHNIWKDEFNLRFTKFL